MVSTYILQHHSHKIMIAVELIGFQQIRIRMSPSPELAEMLKYPLLQILRLANIFMLVLPIDNGINTSPMVNMSQSFSQIAFFTHYRTL